MREIDSFLEKLKKATNTITDKEMCEAIGLKYNTLDNWKTKDEIPAKRLLELSSKFNIPIDTLNNSEFTKLEINDGYWIKKISHNVSAGTSADIEGIEVFDKDDEKIFLPSTFFKTQMNDKYLRYFQVEGDSMFPKLRSGDWVVMKLVKCFDGDALYVINYQNILMVKALQLKPNGHLFIKSLNPDYESYDLSPESQNIFKIIGKVIKSIT